MSARAMAMHSYRPGGLVQYEHAGVLDERTRDGDALLLTARHRHAALSKHRLVAGRKRADEVVRMRLKTKITR